MEIHNLDESVKEYFEFIVCGHKYRVKHMNTEEMEGWKKITDDNKSKEYLFSFIKKMDEKSPNFSDISKKMIVPHWNKFKEMIKVEFGG